MNLIFQSGVLLVSSSSGFDLSEVITHHLSDAVLWHLEWMGYDISITKRVVMMWLVTFFLLLIFVPVARKISKNPYKKPSRFQSLVEVLVSFVRNDICKASLGSHSRPYEPFLLNIFFFILFCNLIGLIPSIGEILQVSGETLGLLHHEVGGHTTPFLVKLWPGITSTGDISVTAPLSIFVLLVILITGFAFQGIAYIKNIVPAGVPAPIAFILWPIELIGLIIKPSALALRLLANMTAGHIIILILMSFIFQSKSYLVAPISVVASAAIYLLEIFVAFLQAYIFTFLASLFISEAQHRH